jgi:hypothetical protein
MKVAIMEEALSDHFLDFIHPDDRIPTREASQRWGFCSPSAKATPSWRKFRWTSDYHLTGTVSRQWCFAQAAPPAVTGLSPRSSVR